ncbi:MAG: SirB2 family protein [Pseudomonadota bacterium]|nr:MAG: SirB2 family protein [Pseudomonadota bacterium]
MMYETIKLIHVASAMISITGFIVRGLWMLVDSPMLQARWVRIAPHVIDTTLLGSAIYLALTIQQYPGVNTWLSAKVIAVVLYIVLGMIALRRGKTKQIRVMAWVAALATFAYIVAVALTRSAAVLF